MTSVVGGKGRRARSASNCSCCQFARNRCSDKNATSSGSSSGSCLMVPSHLSSTFFVTSLPAVAVCLLRPNQRNLLGGPAVPREDALILFDRCQVVIELAYTAFTSGSCRLKTCRRLHTWRVPWHVTCA